MDWKLEQQRQEKKQAVGKKNLSGDSVSWLRWSVILRRFLAGQEMLFLLIAAGKPGIL